MQEPQPDLFKAGDVFAGRYRMIARIGRGGMGDVWRADDLVLEAPVALKIIHSTGPDGRARILNEVRLARQVTHPAVCRVFDVGEGAGQVFLSMELVQGEDLATLLKRAGRLPSRDVVEIARQLCAGLAAAHAQGVLHRDLKPANVLVSHDGHVRITDFGIATTDGGPSEKAVGSLWYMAPEQLDPGASLSERTDLYALGLVLYELVVGEHPWRQPGKGAAAPRPSTLVPDVDPQLERVIMRAIAADPRDRPASADDMAASLPGGSTGAARTPRWWFAGAAVVGAAAILALVASLYSTRGARALTGQDTIVLADFANATGEPVFDGALKVALAVALEQSPFLKIFPDNRTRETLRLMDRSPDEAITRSVAREIALREQVKALIAGSIAGLGKNYVLTLEAVNAENGEVMAREQAEATSKEDVLTALGAAASRLRETLGESLASIEQFDVPLARATTSSLDALQAYSLALDEGTANPRMEALPHLQRAIGLDPDFALAHAMIATVYANTGRTSLALEPALKAFELRERVSERERFFITFRYHRDATQNWAEALELTKSWTTTYPRESFAFNSLGAALSRFGQYDQAIPALAESIRLDPRFAAAYSNLGLAHLALNRPDEVRKVLQEAEARKVTSSPIRRLGYLLAFQAGDTAAMARLLDASVGVGQTNAAYGWQAHSSAFSGHAREAHEHFRLGVEMATQGGFKEVAANLAVEDAEVHALVGQCAEARAEVSDGLSLARDNFSIERASRVLALCGRDAEATALLRELRQRFPDATLTARVSLPLTSAAIALRGGEPSRALELLESLRPYDHVPRAEFWPAYLRGQAYLAQKDGRAAGVEFQSILDHRGEYPNAPLYPLAQLGAARAAALVGDVAKAVSAYDAFLGLWNGADRDLPPLMEAHRESARLR
jgi:tetratricopeptide (TPR) repeat protein/predicted Ser/Thr protein kinase